MELRNYLVLPLILTTLLSGCSLFNYEEDVIKMSPLPKVENQVHLQKVWKSSVGKGVGDFYSKLHPAWLGNSVFAADRFGIVKSLDTFSGKEKWRIDLSEKTGFFSKNISALLSGGITVVGDHIYISSERGRVFSLNSSDGSIVWQTQLNSEALSCPVVSDGFVLIHTSNGALHGLDQNTGKEKWDLNLDVPLTLSLRGESTPATAFGGAIVGGDNGRVTAVMIKRGQIIWQQLVSLPGGTTEIDRLNDIDSTPVIVGNVVYALGYKNVMTALDLRSGEILWKRKIGGVRDIVVDHGNIYLVDKEDRVIALTADGGATIWSQNALMYRALTSPILFNGWLIVGDSEGYLHGINTIDGHFITQKKLGSKGFQSDFVVADDKLIIQSKDGDIYALKKHL
ncbi:outer membrane protein assembly factor BamB [Pantoea sp. Nvir]|uniref:outer membrane protein assembly factor BamB n=1 Tax=Pantoea sp. Nvir TaxID=2576760 RepID=UPI0027F97078|nr:outer membrane protein assembly factor BamB [Pantoea sp. Nvir]CAJ0992223.1 Outer membrane protein assembly factor BamB [Pantoea sp. Nvir]